MGLRAWVSPIAIVLVAVTVRATGHQPAMGTIAGRVLDASRAPLPGATVTARPYGQGAARTMTSRSDGSYDFSRVSDGVYYVDAELQGFDVGRRHDVRVQGAPAGGDVELAISPMCECIGVAYPGARVSLQGTVTDGRGNALPHASLALERDGATLERAYADARGRFTARVAESQIYVLVTGSPGFLTQRTTIRVREAGRGSMTVGIEMAPDSSAVARPELERLSQGCGCPGIFSHPGK